MTAQPVLTSVYLFVRDLDASLAFYQRLGIEIESIAGGFARAKTQAGCGIEFGTADVTRRYDPDWQEPSGASQNTLNFDLGSAEAVDATYAEMTAAGYVGHLAPMDAFWGARFAIVDDPDGNVVGLHGPRMPREGRS
jgi:uncharacterized glyoxalase superfamily protein PhnB